MNNTILNTEEHDRIEKGIPRFRETDNQGAKVNLTVFYKYAISKMKTRSTGADHERLDGIMT